MTDLRCRLVERMVDAKRFRKIGRHRLERNPHRLRKGAPVSLRDTQPVHPGFQPIQSSATTEPSTGPFSVGCGGSTSNSMKAAVASLRSRHQPVAGTRISKTNQPSVFAATPSNQERGAVGLPGIAPAAI
ncbi:hypothetical protein [Prosthecomicrobium hirschii]|uniref:hypothetical protein n=1 Tax=Prosthecodimorpha hirschii TaxID=665126 RepID=UPI002220DD62|nr:hypothetical protein [Prosthecomicrobium hirschii]MCW1843771.1 hypothetical protein [Prosthecomicrobium hirschii]